MALRGGERRTSESGEGDTNTFTPPRSPLRVMNVLEELASEPRGLALVRLCERLQTPKTTVLSLLRALEESNYVIKSKGLYRLGDASLRLSSLIAVSFPFPHSVHDLLIELMTRCNETAMLSTLSEDGQAAVYVDKVESQRPVRFSVSIGARRPLHSAAIGKVLLAYQDEAFRNHFLKYSTFEPFEGTATPDKGTLKREIAQIRKDALAEVFHEGLGVGVFAAPVFDGVGNIAACLSLAGPLDRIRDRRIEYIPEVRAIARKMSLLLGWKPEIEEQD